MKKSKIIDVKMMRDWELVQGKIVQNLLRWIVLRYF